MINISKQSHYNALTMKQPLANYKALAPNTRRTVSTQWKYTAAGLTGQTCTAHKQNSVLNIRGLTMSSNLNANLDNI